MPKARKHPPPKSTREDANFKSLLRRLVAVPREEIERKRAEHRDRKVKRKE
jgi:hypothetical protein